MGKLRQPKTFPAAITKVMGALSDEACAEVTGRSASLVRKWSDPDHEALPNMEQALALDVAFVAEGCGEPPIFRAYEAQLNLQLQNTIVEHKPVSEHALQLQANVGAFAEMILQAVNPGGDGGAKLTTREKIDLLDVMEKISRILAETEKSITEPSIN